MSQFEHHDPAEMGESPATEPEAILVEVVRDPSRPLPVARIVRPRVRTPVVLFIVTCLSTLFAGGFREGIDAAMEFGPAAGLRAGLIEGLKFALPLMTILIFHEMGHWLQARRYRVYASLPYFIPMPISPFGTFGAVIAMDSRAGDRRALFDIGISGPLAGLVPTILFCAVGLHLSQPAAGPPDADEIVVGSSVLFKLLAAQMVGPNAGPFGIELHPMAFAGWVGLLITSLNLIPIGQLDGGHILYGLLRERANHIASLLLLAAVVSVIALGLWGWSLMLVLLVLIGPVHPPTANDNVSLGPVRIILGWLTLAFVPLGFTPTPILLAS